MTNDTNGDIVNGRVIPCSEITLYDNIISKMLNGYMTANMIKATANNLQSH